MPYPAPRLSEQVVALILVAMAVIAFTMDRSAAMDLCGPESPDPFGRALWMYGELYDPLVSANPHFLRVMSGISAFVFGPLELSIAYGIWTRRPWVDRPAIVWSIAMLYSMLVHTVVELWGSRPPPHPSIALTAYSAYVVVPLVLLRWYWPARTTRGAPPR